jgi:hypothetical protein
VGDSLSEFRFDLVFDAIDSRLDLLVGIDFGTVVSAAPHPNKKFSFPIK